MTASPRPRWFRRHPRLALLLIVVAGTVVIDVASATVLQVCGLWDSRPPDAFYRESHPVYHHTLQKSVSFDGARWGSTIYPLRTDSLGCRAREVRDVPLRTDRYRLLLIGDSFTEGLALPWEDTFAGMLEAHLEPRGVEVLNAGVVSYCPTIYLEKVRHLLEVEKLEIDHLAVFLDLSDIEDEYERYRVEPEQGGVVSAESEGIDDFLKRFVAEHTILISTARELLKRLRKGDNRVPRTEVDEHLGRRRCLWTVEPALFEEYGRQGLAAATARMDELADFLGARDVDLTVVVYPWPDQIERHDLESVHVVHWRAWAERHGAGFVDCFPAFIDARPAREVILAHFIPGDIHWNRAGNAVIAERVLAKLAPRLPR